MSLENTQAEINTFGADFLLDEEEDLFEDAVGAVRRKRRKGPRRLRRPRRPGLKAYKHLMIIFQKQTGLNIRKAKKAGPKATLKFYLIALGWAKKNRKNKKLIKILGKGSVTRGLIEFKLGTDVLRDNVGRSKRRLGKGRK